MPEQRYARQPVSVDVDGKTYDGSFIGHEKMVTVWYAGLTRAAHLLGSSHPENLARILLVELVREQRDKRVTAQQPPVSWTNRAASRCATCDTFDVRRVAV